MCRMGKVLIMLLAIGFVGLSGWGFSSVLPPAPNSGRNKMNCIIQRFPEPRADGVVIWEFEYDGCQYIQIGDVENAPISHKGNCRGCQKRLEKMLDQLKPND